MYPHELIEVLCAAHLSYWVDSPWPERGGIILVGPPGVLKTTFLEELDRHYPDVLTLSDLNAKTVVRFRDQVAAGTINTLIFPELGKLYQRRGDTAANLEGTLQALASEGFLAASFEDARINRQRARCLVMGAMTPALQESRFEQWESSGFNRRFLWSLLRLSDPRVLDEAVALWRRIDFRVHHVPHMPTLRDRVPNLTTRAERERCRALVKYQPGGSTVQQAQLLVKILAVLKWWYAEVGRVADPMQVIESFGQSLGREGAALVLEPVAAHPLRERESRSRGVRTQPRRRASRSRRHAARKRRR